MSKIKITSVLVLLTVAIAIPEGAWAQPKSLFYMTRSYGSVNSFMEHYNKIDILVPTWYEVDKDGMVWGGPDPLVLKTAKEHHVEVMPIITGFGFNPQVFHQFVTNSAARKPFIQALIRECKLYGYSGIQFDFEHLNWFDSDALSNLVAETAAALHQNGYKLSIATVPNAPGYPGQDRLRLLDFQGVAGRVRS